MIGFSPSESLAMINAVMAETIGMTMYNAVNAQRGGQVLTSAAVTTACARMLSRYTRQIDSRLTGASGPRGAHWAAGTARSSGRYRHSGDSGSRRPNRLCRPARRSRKAGATGTSRSAGLAWTGRAGRN
jgi:hypothetical protein